MAIMNASMDLVADTPQRIDAEGVEDVALFNAEGNPTVYVGPEDVTTATGLPILAGKYFSARLGRDESAWVVAGSACTVKVLRIS